jgi:pilus assembly protein Flp/PilA
MTIRPILIRTLAALRGEDDGQGLVEYALILALIAIISIVALFYMGSQVSDKLSVIGGQLQSVAP